jgi:hypothetical protein
MSEIRGLFISTDGKMDYIKGTIKKFSAILTGVRR